MVDNKHLEGHRGRLRERFLMSGLGAFLDYEIIELLLTLGTPRRDCKAIAKETITRFGGLRQVLEASPEELQSIKGIGPNNYFGLKLFQETSKRLAKEKIPEKIELGTSPLVAEYLNKKIGHEKKEYLVALYLDSRNKLVNESIISVGTVDQSLVHPRELFSEAIKFSASQIIIGHNHPSGETEPSPSDVAITRRISEASKIFGINLIDHLIVTKNNFLSMRERGLI